MNRARGKALAASVEAVARMLPARVSEGGEYRVARAAVEVALPHLLEHLGPVLVDDVQAPLLVLHPPQPQDQDRLRVCQEDLQPWPYATVRLCGSNH